MQEDAARYTGDSQAATLLLVDDEENILAALKRLLRREGYRLLTAASGAEGLGLLREQRVDVIVSDQRMPQMTGVDFLRKAKELCPETIRIVLSGYTELQSIIDAVNEGAVYKFLTKPWDDDLLRQHIREAVQLKRMRDENLHLTQQLAQANAALENSNRELQRLLASNREALRSDETVLEIHQEILESLPLAIVGIDDQGMIVFVNRLALNLLFVGNACTIGDDIGECLPPPLLEILGQGSAEGEACCFGGKRYRVLCRRMGISSASRGKVLLAVPDGENGAAEAGDAVPCQE